MRRSLPGLLLPLVVTGIELASAILVIGAPDLAAAARFLTTTTPTMPDGIAAAEAAVWIGLLAAAMGTLVATLRGAIDILRGSAPAALWSLVLVVIGLAVLGVGAGRHLSAERVDLAGGSVSQARAQLVVPSR
ncbi:MAG TPA: hypothetical protein VKY90_21450 [Candidatus Dormibacteraeota bacterium]|nr:hypothetical protein [Candidatus Dormibacteraeota bacterium]